MGKKSLFAAALAAGAAAVVSNAVLNDTLRRRPPNKDPLPDDEETRAATVWFKKYAKRVTYRNPENMRLTAWFIPHKGHRYAHYLPRLRQPRRVYAPPRQVVL